MIIISDFIEIGLISPGEGGSGGPMVESLLRRIERKDQQHKVEWIGDRFVVTDLEGTSPLSCVQEKSKYKARSPARRAQMGNVIFLLNPRFNTESQVQ